MELFLYQLSIWGLALTSLMIAIFFLVLRAANPRAEMRWWTLGWFANVVAMLTTVVFWYTQPPAYVHPYVFAIYFAAKNAYAWLLLRGTLEVQSRRPRWLDTNRVWPVIIAVSIAGLLVVTTRDRLGVVSQAVVGCAFAYAAVSLARSRVPSAQWIVIALSGRALLGFAESAAYAVNVIRLATGEQSARAFAVPADWILAAHYPLDTGAEWLVAMGFVIGVSVRAQRELHQANQQMVTATRPATSAWRDSRPRLPPASAPATPSFAMAATSSWWWHEARLTSRSTIASTIGATGCVPPAICRSGFHTGSVDSNRAVIPTTHCVPPTKRCIAKSR